MWTSQQEQQYGSVVGRDLTVKGDISSKGDLRIDGQVEGNVNCIALHVGSTGSITGDVAAEDVTVEGRVLGGVQAVSVSLKSESTVEGDITSQTLAIEHGSHFDGKARPTPAAAQAKLEIAAE